MKTLLVTIILSLLPSLALACPSNQMRVSTGFHTWQCVPTTSSSTNYTSITVIRMTPAQAKESALKSEAELAVTIVSRAFDNVKSDCTADQVEAMLITHRMLTDGRSWRSDLAYTTVDGCKLHWYSHALQTISNVSRQRHLRAAFKDARVKTPLPKLISWLQAQIAKLSAAQMIGTEN